MFFRLFRYKDTETRDGNTEPGLQGNAAAAAARLRETEKFHRGGTYSYCIGPHTGCTPTPAATCARVHARSFLLRNATPQSPQPSPSPGRIDARPKTAPRSADFSRPLDGTIILAYNPFGQSVPRF
jgi:uncharacterized protein YfaQ (DUF2300 family)